MTYQEAYLFGKEQLELEAIEDAATDAWLLLEYVTGCSRSQYFMRQREPMLQAETERYRELIEQRAAHIPLQHLTQTQEFMGLPFHVNEHVLIPRQDTEILVEEALKKLTAGKKVLDLCTGSGCIIISLKHYCEGIEGIGSDISNQALEVARENGSRNKTEIQWVLGDLFEHIEGKFDMIVSNPPYIPTEEIAKLSEEVKDHEPVLALDGMEDGLFFYRRIIENSKDYLTENGWLFLEIGYDQGEAVSQLMREAGMQEIHVVKDLAGLDRVVYGGITCLTS